MVIKKDPGCSCPQTAHLESCFKNSSEPDLQRHHLQFQLNSVKDAAPLEVRSLNINLGTLSIAMHTFKVMHQKTVKR